MASSIIAAGTCALGALVALNGSEGKTEVGHENSRMDDGAYVEVASILVEAAEKLGALGFNFSLQRTAEMPQGKVLSLHVATTPHAAAAASVALGQGSYSASSPKTAQQFDHLVAESISFGLIDTVPDWCSAPLSEDPREAQ